MSEGRCGVNEDTKCFNLFGEYIQV